MLGSIEVYESMCVCVGRWSVSESRSARALHSTLSLRVVERGDAGEYTCSASNRFGRSERLILLHVEGDYDSNK